MLNLPATISAAIQNIGRPTSYTAALLAEICSHIVAGYPIRIACAKAGVPESTFNDWRRKNTDLDPVVELARDTALIPAIDGILVAARSGNWRACLTWYKLVHPEAPLRPIQRERIAPTGPSLEPGKRPAFTPEGLPILYQDIQLKIQEAVRNRTRISMPGEL